METAEEFAAQVVAITAPVAFHPEQQAALELAIETNNSAIALAVVAECREWLTKGGFYEHAREIADRMLNSVESKYTQPGGMK